MRSLAKRAPRERRGRTWFCKVLAQRWMDWTAELLVRESQQKEEAGSKRRRRERRSQGAGSGTSSDCGENATTFGKEDTQFRQPTRNKPGALGMSVVVQMIRQTGETAGSWGADELDAAFHSPLPLENPAAEQPPCYGRTQDVSRSDGWPCDRSPRSEVGRRCHRRRLGTGSPRGTPPATEVHDDSRHAGGNGPQGKKELRSHRESRPSKHGQGIEEHMYPDPKNNAKGAGEATEEKRKAKAREMKRGRKEHPRRKNAATTVNQHCKLRGLGKLRSEVTRASKSRDDCFKKSMSENVRGGQGCVFRPFGTCPRPGH